jgi:hypothetical protein
MSEETFTPDQLPFAVNQAEFDQLQNGELSNQAIISEMISRFTPEFRWPDEKKGYNPRENSVYKKCKQYEEFFIHYSFPYNNESPVASFWLYQEGGGQSPYQYVHIDVHKIIKQIVEHYKTQGYIAPPPRD